MNKIYQYLKNEFEYPEKLKEVYDNYIQCKSQDIEYTPSAARNLTLLFKLDLYITKSIVRSFVFEEIARIHFEMLDAKFPDQKAFAIRERSIIIEQIKMKLKELEIANDVITLISRDCVYLSNVENLLENLKLEI